ncbi:hypothetical protein [Anaerovibrio lipolyticus]|uniref:hypothetical protein n=1 Tax=Anaerovibrio lipolyticus TaxID=82374 RepID=UPI00047F3F5A|nr:hypothetical protein [Anaerovibrio lipolyticus]
MSNNEKLYIRQHTHIVPFYHTVDRKDLYDSWNCTKILNKIFYFDVNEESIYYRFDSLIERPNLLNKEHDYLSASERDAFEFSLLLTNKDGVLSDIPIFLFSDKQVISIHDITITLYGNGIGFLSYDIGSKAEFGDSAKNISEFCKKYRHFLWIGVYKPYFIMPSEIKKSFDFSENDNINELIANIYSNSYDLQNMSSFSFTDFIEKLLDNLIELISSSSLSSYHFFDYYACRNYFALYKPGINMEYVKNVLPDFVLEYNGCKEPEMITNDLFCYTDINCMIFFSCNPFFELKMPTLHSERFSNYFSGFIKYKMIQRVYTDVLQQYYFLKSLSQLYAYEKLPKDPQAYSGNLSDDLYKKIKELRLKINLFYLLNTTSFVSYEKSINDIYLYAKKECNISEISGNLEKGVDAIAEMSQQVMAENNTKRLKKVERVVGILAFFGICSVFADSLSFCDQFFDAKDKLPQLLENFNINKKEVPGQWITLICIFAVILAFNITGLLGLIIPEGILNFIIKIQNKLLKTPEYIRDAISRIKYIKNEGLGVLFPPLFKELKKTIKRNYILHPGRLLFVASSIPLVYIVAESQIISIFDEEVQWIFVIILFIYSTLVLYYTHKILSHE